MTKAIILIVVILSIAFFLFKDYKQRVKRSYGNDPIAKLEFEDKMFDSFVDTAQKELPYLITFMKKYDKNDTLFRYAVKTNFEEDGKYEHMWVQVYAFKNGFFIGTLANEPSTVKSIKFGDSLKVHRDKVEDWILEDHLTNTSVGGFSQKYLRDKAK